MTFDESSFPNSNTGVETSPTPPPPILPAAVPNPLAQPPIITIPQAPSPTQSDSENAVDSRGRWVRHAELLAAAHVRRDPISYSEAMRSAYADQWREACQYEMDVLAKNGNCELLDLPTARRAVKSTLPRSLGG